MYTPLPDDLSLNVTKFMNTVQNKDVNKNNVDKKITELVKCLEEIRNKPANVDEKNLVYDTILLGETYVENIREGFPEKAKQLVDAFKNFKDTFKSSQVQKPDPKLADSLHGSTKELELEQTVDTKKTKLPPDYQSHPHYLDHELDSRSFVEALEKNKMLFRESDGKFFVAFKLGDTVYERVFKDLNSVNDFINVEKLVIAKKDFNSKYEHIKYHSRDDDKKRAEDYKVSSREFLGAFIEVLKDPSSKKNSPSLLKELEGYQKKLENISNPREFLPILQRCIKLADSKEPLPIKHTWPQKYKIDHATLREDLNIRKLFHWQP